MKKVTPFGRFVRLQRMDRGMVLIDMSEYLEVSPSMLSMVELGRKKVPLEWLPKIIEILGLDEADARKIEKLAKESNNLREARIPVSIPEKEAAFTKVR